MFMKLTFFIVGILFIHYGCSTDEEKKPILKQKKIISSSCNSKVSKELIDGVRLGASYKEWKKSTPWKNRVVKLNWKGKEIELSYELSANYENDEIEEIFLSNNASDGKIKKYPLDLNTIADIYSQKYNLIPLNTDVGILQKKLLLVYKELENLEKDEFSFREEFLSSKFIFFYDPTDDILILLTGIPSRFYGYEIVQIRYQYRSNWIKNTLMYLETSQNAISRIKYENQKKKEEAIGKF
jgi:hypothetical protein